MSNVQSMQDFRAGVLNFERSEHATLRVESDHGLVTENGRGLFLEIETFDVDSREKWGRITEADARELTRRLVGRYFPGVDLGAEDPEPEKVWAEGTPLVIVTNEEHFPRGTAVSVVQLDDFDGTYLVEDAEGETDWVAPESLAPVFSETKKDAGPWAEGTELRVTSDNAGPGTDGLRAVGPYEGDIVTVRYTEDSDGDYFVSPGRYVHRSFLEAL